MVKEVNLKLRLSANDTYGFYETIHSLNEIIGALWKLSDTKYYLSGVFNGGTESDAEIRNTFSEDDLTNLAYKFERIRGIVLSEALEEYSDNFKNFEYAILQSVWEHEYPNDENGNTTKYEKMNVKNSYNEFIKSATELKKYFCARYGEEIKE